jgi:hypothetical protein
MRSCGDWLTGQAWQVLGWLLALAVVVPFGLTLGALALAWRPSGALAHSRVHS